MIKYLISDLKHSHRLVNQKMSEDEIIWDYSQVPPLELKWYFTQEKDHWMEVHIKHSGLTYVGTDWSVQSGGGYFGGFQTFEEFFSNGPIQKMPEQIAAGLRKHLLTYRVPGGAKLRLLHLNKVDGLVLQGAYVHLDDKPITVSIDETLAQKQELLIFDGSIGLGKHQFSLLLVFRSKLEGGDKIWKAHGEFTFEIESGMHTIRLETTLERDGSIQIRRNQ